MAKYYVTITIPIDVPEKWDNDEAVEDFLTGAVDQEVSIAYELDDYRKAGE